MFEIYADEILFEKKTVAIMALRESTLRDRVCEALETVNPEAVYTEEEYETHGDNEFQRGRTDALASMEKAIMEMDDLTNEQATTLFNLIEELS